MALCRMGRWEKKNSEGKQSNTAAHNLRLVYFCTELKPVFISVACVILFTERSVP